MHRQALRRLVGKGAVRRLVASSGTQAFIWEAAPQLYAAGSAGQLGSPATSSVSAALKQQSRGFAVVAAEDSSADRIAQSRNASSSGRKASSSSSSSSSSSTTTQELYARIQSDAAAWFETSLIRSTRIKALPPVQLSAERRMRMLDSFRRFQLSGWASDQSRKLYITANLFPTAASKFRKFIIKYADRELLEALTDFGPSDEADRLLFALFEHYCQHFLAKQINEYKSMVQSADLKNPHEWYPLARAVKRGVIYHAGPTNSGKTYEALQAWMSAKSGLYCGPLRLLAMEVWDKGNAQGTYCDLITGQERISIPFAHHAACTIEMANINKLVDVAVIDEIQMISDDYRGWAWTRALLGLPADQIHVCGDASALPIVEHLCKTLGEPLEVRRYERFTPLVQARASLRSSFARVEPGDCIVAFSRKDIFKIRQEIEAATNLKCCVLYGGLPPETRRQQAKLFNDPSSGYNVLVASDAIGMGLNLNIKRVIFYTVKKFNGVDMDYIPITQVKQIAGRAGRRGSEYEEGSATTFHAEDRKYLAQALKLPLDENHAAGLFPTYEQMEVFASQLPGESFPSLLTKFAEASQLDGSFKLCRHDAMKQVAAQLEQVTELSLRDRFLFATAPVNTRETITMLALINFARMYATGSPVRLASGIPFQINDDPLQALEISHQLYSLYLWLSYRYDLTKFPDRQIAFDQATKVIAALAQSLQTENLPTAPDTPVGSSKQQKKQKPSSKGEEPTPADERESLEPTQIMARSTRPRHNQRNQPQSQMGDNEWADLWAAAV
eukprot:jgi/Chlat1/5525/Chrsp369S05340